MTDNRQSLHNVTWRHRGMEELLGRQFIWTWSLREAAETLTRWAGWESEGGRAVGQRDSRYKAQSGRRGGCI